MEGISDDVDGSVGSDGSRVQLRALCCRQNRSALRTTFINNVFRSI